MTTTKVIYVIAAIMPFGLCILAAAMLAHAMWVRHKARTEAAAH